MGTRLKIFYIPQTLQGKDDAAKRKSNFTTCHDIKARDREIETRMCLQNSRIRSDEVKRVDVRV
jgi:hypothetical protein